MYEYPLKPPFDTKKVWLYDDIFPQTRPYSLIRCFHHRNYSIGFHSHDFYEINLITNGQGAHYTENDFRETEIGDVVIIPPGKNHAYHSKDNLCVFHFIIHKNFFRRYYSELNMLPAYPLLFNDNRIGDESEIDITYFHIGENDYESMFKLFCELDSLDYNSALSESEEVLPMYLATYAKSIILIANICEAYRKSASFVGDKIKTDSAILAVVNYIHNHYAERLTLDDLCTVAYMSKSTLSKRFCKYIGQSPLSYVNYYRILVAKKLLIETDKSFSEIASEVGFFDYSHFCKIYKKYENISPTNLRQRKGI